MGRLKRKRKRVHNFVQQSLPELNANVMCVQAVFGVSSPFAGPPAKVVQRSRFTDGGMLYADITDLICKLSRWPKPE